MCMTRMPMTFDPTDPAFLQDPYPTYKRLRDESPIFFYEPWNKWIITRHGDVSALLRDRRLGRVLTNVKVRVKPEHAAFDDVQDGSLLELEPPDHTRLRRLLVPEFTMRRLQRLAPLIQRVVDRQLDELEAALAEAPDGVADLVDGFCDHAAAFAEGITAIEGAQVLNDVDFTQVCASFGDDDRTRAVVEAMLSEGTAWTTGSSTTWRAPRRCSSSTTANT